MVLGARSISLQERSFRDWLPTYAITRPQMIASSAWEGVDLQVSHNDGCQIEEAQISGHFIGIHLDDRPLQILARAGGQWMTVVQPPRCIWIHPEGEPFSIKHSSSSRWAGIVVQNDLLSRIMGEPRELTKQYFLNDDLLAHIFMAMVHQITDKDADIAKNERLAQYTMMSLLHIIGARYSTLSMSKGGITDYYIKLLDNWIEARLADMFTVEEMADVVHLSVSHFTREFKKSTGITPWNYVRNAKVRRARLLLANGESASEVVRQCGFADQAHLSRTVKTQYGVTPTQLRRAGLAGRR